MGGQDLFSGLPEDCISHIISLTSPRDACRCSAASSIVLSASESDVVWERFLPPDYPYQVERFASPVQFSTKKELFFRLCPVLFDGGKMSFSKENGRKCYMLSARKLCIKWSGTPWYWKWTSLPESRFQEVAELLDVCWLEILGKIDSHILSPKTTYKAYLVIKYAEMTYGLDYIPSETSVILGDYQSNNIAYLQQPGSPKGDELVPQARNDEWMEIEIGEFINDEGEDGDVEITVKETRGGHWKRGIIIEGIEIRPVCK